MSNRSNQYFILIFTGLLSVLFFLVPLFLIPVGLPDPEIDKQFILLSGTGVVLIFYCIYLLRPDSVFHASSPIDGLILLLPLIYGVSAIVRSPNPMESMIRPMGTLSIFAMTVLYFMMTLIRSRKPINLLEPLLYASPLISLYVIASHIALLNRFMKYPVSPMGSLMDVSLFLIFISFCLLIEAIRRIRKKSPYFSSISRFNLGLLLSLSGSALLFAFFHLFTDQRPQLLPLWAGLSVAFQGLTDLPTYFYGVGSGYYGDLFSKFKPILLNRTAFWSITPTESSTFVLTALSEIGIVPIIAGIMLTGKLVFSLLRRTQKNRYSGLFIPLAISILILLIFLPANLTILLITYILLASLTPVQTVRSKSLTYLSRFPILKDYIFISIILFILFSISLCFKLYTYDLNFRIASSADTPFSTGKIEKLKQLTTNVPWKEPYHLGYAYFLQSEIQTQYGLLEKNSGLLKPLTSLTMETVEEIKIAIRLHPDSSTNWKTLGRAYELASKLDPSFRADAIRAYEESMRLDPNSPEPMVLLGRLYGTLDQTSEAGQLIRNALKLKPDYANAYYQLAIISAKQENYIEAAAFMSNAIFLTPKTSSDLPRLELELNRLQKLIK